MAENPERVIRVVKEAADSIVGGIGDVITAMRDMGRAMSEIAKAVPGRDLTRVLADLATTVAGGIRVTTTVPREDASVYYAINGTITGTTVLTVWNPPTGCRFLLKGYLVTAVVATVLNAGDEVAVYFADSADSNRVVAPIGSLAINAAAGTVLNRDVPEMSSGRLGSIDTANLVITTNATIDTGVIRFAGVCWGDEVKV